MDTRYTLKANNNKPSEMKHSAYTNNEGYGRNSKYSPIKRDTTPSKLNIGRNQLNVSNNVQGGNNTPLSSRNRVRTFTSPVY